MTVRTCHNCHGKGTVKVENPSGEWKTVTCPACNGTGKINTKLI